MDIDSLFLVRNCKMSVMVVKATIYLIYVAIFTFILYVKCYVLFYILYSCVFVLMYLFKHSESKSDFDTLLDTC